MTKDTITSVTGAIGLAAIVANWILKSLNVDFQIPKEIQEAIAGLCVFIIAWYIGKPGNNPENGGKGE